MLTITKKEELPLSIQTTLLLYWDYTKNLLYQ